MPRWCWKDRDRDRTSHLPLLGWLKDGGHWCLQSVELHLSPSFGLNSISCFQPPNHHFLLISAACKGLQVQRAALELLTGWWAEPSRTTVLCVGKEGLQAKLVCPVYNNYVNGISGWGLGLGTTEQVVFRQAQLLLKG